MSDRLPLFPLNTVLFPGATMRLHVFEDRYRALVQHLLTVRDKTARVFGVVAIREGFEVGSTGRQSLHRVGCVAQMTSVTPHADGRFDIEVVGRQRMRLTAVETSGPYPVGVVDLLDPAAEARIPAEEAARAALPVFRRYRARLAQLRGAENPDVRVPTDTGYLSYALAAACVLTLRQRQELLEADTARERLVLLRLALREELRAMRAVPSLPATDVARTRWSPN